MKKRLLDFLELNYEPVMVGTLIVVGVTLRLAGCV